MREENKEYNKIYEGNNLNTLANNLIPYTNYEFRICCIYKDDIGEWTENKKIKTKEFSNILNDCPRKEEFIKLLKEWSGYKNMELIYRGTKDGGDNNNFHKKCDNQGPTIILCKNDKEIYLEDIHLFPGLMIIVENIKKLMVHLYLH